ncbi:hypothetical protein ACFX15_029402 [Malus domestica]|uniref:Uncharacterized protein n=1 Tax=Malus domestica TaxID=3750 RepID=A0A498KEK2_MALDO|nr:hypothetical protein DVH24_039098 [Malus domestica]RXI09943.1 hypothetical protein DVH24_018972 [Malus domestica]
MRVERKALQLFSDVQSIGAPNQRMRKEYIGLNGRIYVRASTKVVGVFGISNVSIRRCSQSKYVYRAGYYPTNTILQAGLRVRPSFIWPSLVWGKDNGIALSVYNWIPRPMRFKICSLPILPSYCQGHIVPNANMTCRGHLSKY